MYCPFFFKFFAVLFIPVCCCYCCIVLSMFLLNKPLVQYVICNCCFLLIVILFSLCILIVMFLLFTHCTVLTVLTMEVLMDTSENNLWVRNVLVPMCLTNGFKLISWQTLCIFFVNTLHIRIRNTFRILGLMLIWKRFHVLMGEILCY